MKVSEFLKLLYTDCQMVRLLEYDDGNDEGKELFYDQAAKTMKSEHANRIVESFIPGLDLIIYVMK